LKKAGTKTNPMPIGMGWAAALGRWWGQVPVSKSLIT
jgi:hypothetical protein